MPKLSVSVLNLNLESEVSVPRNVKVRQRLYLDGIDLGHMTFSFIKCVITPVFSLFVCASSDHLDPTSG